MANQTGTDTMLQLIATASRYSERAAEKADRVEIALRDTQQDVQLNRSLIERNGTRLDRVELRLDALEAGQRRIEAIVLRILEQHQHR
ncbi:MAG: hypothetical protein AAFY20_18150 [Cyanobacteria bacterium J06639_14]